MADGGQYDVVVTGPCGPQTSEPAQLTVHPLPECDIDVDEVLCPNETYQAYAPVGLVDYHWTVAGGSLLTGQGTNTISFQPGTGAADGHRPADDR